MGWYWGLAVCALIAAATAGLLAALRVPRMLWPLVGAALMLGMAGYSWQDGGDAPAHPVAYDAVKLPPGEGYKAMRGDLFGRFGGESMYFAISDVGLEGGDTVFAAEAIIGATNYAPNNAAFWTELGNIIALHDNNVSPASLLAFRRAMQAAPSHPGPPYFLGFAYIRAGQYAEAQRWWRHALALTPPKASYRDGIAKRLAMLDALLADQGRGQGPAPRR